MQWDINTVDERRTKLIADHGVDRVKDGDNQQFFPPQRAMVARNGNRQRGLGVVCHMLNRRRFTWLHRPHKLRVR